VSPLRKGLVVVLAALLVAAAFFLPAKISEWNDRQLLDEPHVIQEDAREGFAESVQLTVAEKLLLLQSGTLSSMDLVDDVVQGLIPLPGQQAAAATIVRGSSETEETDAAAYDADQKAYDDKVLLSWSTRLSEVLAEVRTLQAMGALPQLWDADSDVEYIGYGEMLYLDSTTRMSFQVYRMQLSGAPYSLDVTVDAQSRRILAFVLDWASGTPLNWGLRGAANFGAAWRDYWGLDSVSISWYSDYVRDILENTEALLRNNGEYNSNGQVVFTYGGQILNIPLANWAFYDRDQSLWWNYMQTMGSR